VVPLSVSITVTGWVVVAIRVIVMVDVVTGEFVRVACFDELGVLMAVELEEAANCDGLVVLVVQGVDGYVGIEGLNDCH
jgi:hypothetical protein